MPQTERVRPVGLWVGDRFEFGLEVELVDGCPVKWGSTSLPPDPFWLSPAFVNAHSHLEYRGLQGRLNGLEYWPWIRELTRLKGLQTPEEVAAECLVAARENHITGVALIGEHSDRPFAAAAMAEAGIEGWVFQELITFFEAADPSAKWTAVEENARSQRRFARIEVEPNPHASWSVDRASLERFGKEGNPVSIHVAETPFEAQLFEDHSGPIADLFLTYGLPLPVRQSLFEMLDEVGLLRPGVQMVHLGATSTAEIERLAVAGVTVAHCPRSNKTLGCPLPDVRTMLDAGLGVGLGMDSAASSGKIDMFDEMRAMLFGSTVTPEEVWNAATTGGAATLGYSNWGTVSNVPLGSLHRDTKTRWIRVNSDAKSAHELLMMGNASLVEWLS